MELVKCKIGNINKTSPYVRQPSPTTYDYGYGFFQPREHSDKPSLLALMFSNNGKPNRWFGVSCNWHDYVKLLHHLEPRLVELAASIKRHGIMTPLAVCSSNGITFDTIVRGRRRLLALAYNALWDKQPAADVEFFATVEENKPDTDMLIRDLSESMSTSSAYIEQATALRFLRKQGMTVRQISEAVGCEHQRIRALDALLNLPDELQYRVQLNTLSFEKALKIFAEIRDGIRDAQGKKKKPS